MTGFMMAREVPTPGVNKLTQRLLAQGVDPQNPATWPENVWRGDGVNFLYKREYRFTPTFESPCGLLIRSFGQGWGDIWADGEFKCCENDNPLFRCPTPGKPCPHRRKGPQGINCQFHRTAREWSAEHSVEEIEKANAEDMRGQWLDEITKYPGWSGVCQCLRRVDGPDGKARYLKQYDVDKCIVMGCQSDQCVCRQGAKRDLRKANIYYDVLVERHYTVGMVEQTDRVIRKGIKALSKPIAMTDAEILLKVWQHDPRHHMAARLWPINPLHELGRHEEFFIRIYGRFEEKENLRVRTEIRNVHISRNEQKDLLADLQMAQEGIAVEHDSDRQAAKAAAKRENRLNSKLDKTAKQYAAERSRGQNGSLAMMGIKDEDEKAEIRRRADKIMEKQARAARIKAEKDGQLSLFDE